VGVNLLDKSLPFNGDAMAQSGKTIDTTEKACQRQTHSLFCLFSEKEKKSFITLATGVSVTKLFSSSMMPEQNKLEHLHFVSFFRGV
jgi:hypothetical protein